MHVTTIDVISVNGKITKGGDNDAHDWASDEDWDHFQNIVSKHNLLVMGSRTYDTVKPEPQAGLLRVVLTSRTEDYKGQAVPGQLEFMSASPQELAGRMEARGYQKMLLVGGQANTLFFAEGLVDEMYLTLEPFVSGGGRDLLNGGDFTANLRLSSVTRLNGRGTLALHYLVDKPPADILS